MAEYSSDRETENHGLTEVLDQIAKLTTRDRVSVAHIVDTLGDRSFAALLLVFPLISASPASAIPGVTSVIGLIVATLVVQIMIGKRSVWLPGFLLRREISARKLRKGIDWLRKPVRWCESFLRKRLRAFVHRPLLLLPLTLILGLSLMMPLLELVPMSGSIASIVIALFAAGLLMRDGLLVLLALGLMAAIPLMIWQIGFAP